MTILYLRHTAASLPIAAGADVKAVTVILGHSTATMTMDLYGQLFGRGGMAGGGAAAGDPAEGDRAADGCAGDRALSCLLSGRPGGIPQVEDGFKERARIDGIVRGRRPSGGRTGPRAAELMRALAEAVQNLLGVGGA